MSRYYGRLMGKAKTAATRTGSTNSGISASVSSWAHSITVSMFAGAEPDNDMTLIRVTQGSEHGGRPVITLSADEMNALASGNARLRFERY